MADAREIKSTLFEIKALDAETGVLSGYGSVKNVVDSVGDVIVDGAYGDTGAILKDGFLALGHDWDDNPIGYFTVVAEDASGLYFEAKFHNTPDAQETRAVVQERLAAGKSVGLSIGYFVLKSRYEDREGKTVRILEQILVKEISVVTVPAMPMALATDCKAGEAGAGSRFEDQVNQLLAAGDDVASRLETFQKDRKQGLSDTNRERARLLGEMFTKMAAEEKPAPVFETVPDDLLAFARTLS